MSTTLTTAKVQLAEQLSDANHLIWPESALEEALRTALADLSKVYGAALTLSGLDGAVSTTVEDVDTHLLILGGVVYATRFRLMGRFEEAAPEELHPEKLAPWATAAMAAFQSELTMVRLRKFQESSDQPYAAWDWEEGEAFG